jgi:diguanylate cyclase (GGDEF)-like protein
MHGIRREHGVYCVYRQVSEDMLLIDTVKQGELFGALRQSAPVGVGIVSLAAALLLGVLYAGASFYFRRLTLLVERDPLTSLANRRAFDRALAAAYRKNRTRRVPLSLIMLDIDHFKAINDRWGHASGDAVLQRLGSVCGELVRQSDTVARMGGEEFGVLLPDTDIQTAASIAERMRLALAATICSPDTRSADAADIRFTASFGVAELPPDTPDSPEILISCADKRMYRAKAHGRNRVVATD